MYGQAESTTTLTPGIPPCSSPQAARHIGYAEFRECLQQIAKEKRMELAELHDAIAMSGGPMLNSTCV